MNVARLNMSHGSHDSHKAVIDMVSSRVGGSSTSAAWCAAVKGLGCSAKTSFVQKPRQRTPCTAVGFVTQPAAVPGVGLTWVYADVVSATSALARSVQRGQDTMQLQVHLQTLEIAHPGPVAE